MLFALEDVRDKADEGPVGECRISVDVLYFECEGDRKVGILDSG